MTKADLVSSIARKTGQQKANVAATIDAFFEEVKNSVTQGNTIYLRGFGNFFPKYQARRKGRNIRKNTEITIEAHNMPAFKPCKEFMDQVKNWEGGKK